MAIPYYLLHNNSTNETIIHTELSDILFEKGFRMVTRVSNSRVDIPKHNQLVDDLYKEQYYA